VSPTASLDPASFRHLLPEARVGEVEAVHPITMGLSGAAVYAVSTSRGPRILKVRGDGDDESWAQQLAVQRRAAALGVAPAILHVDEQARAVVAERVDGVPIAAALGDPAQRGRVLASVVDRLRVLHGADQAGVPARDPLVHALATWETQRDRPGLPAWCGPVPDIFDAIRATIAGDPRLGLSHNDLNPSNVLWDGARAWLVDWDVSGLNHPHYDLAALATFLALGTGPGLDLAALHDGAPLDAGAAARFAALRQLAALLCGLTLLRLVPDLAVRPAPTPADAPTLQAFYAALRQGALDLGAPVGRASFGLALLRVGVSANDG